MLMAGIGAAPVLAVDVEDQSGVFGNLRVGFITADDELGGDTDGSAIGGWLGYVTPRWRGLSAGATFFTTQELFDDSNGDFFSSDNNSYSIRGEVYLQGTFGNTMIKAGRYRFDSPYADTDDIRMIPNTFEGALITNTDLSNIVLYLTHLDEWAGVDADRPEEFQELNGDHGITAGGAVYDGIGNLALQAWYYYGHDFAKLLYLEAVYETGLFAVGAQYGDQADDTDDNSGPDGKVYGYFGSVTLYHVTLVTAYNDVSGTVTNGFGGGPFFTSADDHTIDGTADQKAAAFNLEYGGVEGLTLGVWHTDFDIGEDDTDYYALYDVNDGLGLEFIHTDMYDDGHFVRLIVNYRF